MKIVFCGYEIKTSATRATRKPRSLANKGFSGVAVPENVATRAATHCYPHIIKGRRKTDYGALPIAPGTEKNARSRLPHPNHRLGEMPVPGFR